MSNKLSASEERAYKCQTYCLTKEPISPYSNTELKKDLPSYVKCSGMVIGDVIKDAVDSDLIQGEKIGTSMWFWVFPADETKKTQNKNQKLKNDIKSLEKKLKSLQENLSIESKAREETEEREKLIKTYNELKKRKSNNAKIIANYKANDPIVFKEFLNSVEIGRKNANRWTENLFCVVSYVKKLTGLRNSEVYKTLGIDPEIDEIE